MKHKNLYWGLFFIFAAVLVVLNQFDFLLGVSTFKLIITLFLIPVIFTSLKHVNFSGILFPLAIIAILYADKLGIQKLTPWPILGVALFLSIGLSIIFPHRHKFITENWTVDNNDYKDRENWSTQTSDESCVNVAVRFGAVSKYINSQNLRNVNIDCHFGAAEVYFDNAEIDGNEAVANISASFSGVELYVPRNWHVENQMDCVLGGVDEKGARTVDVKDKKLIIRGKVSLGGVEIKYI